MSSNVMPNDKKRFKTRFRLRNSNSFDDPGPVGNQD
jgi:hypothetical protein